MLKNLKALRDERGISQQKLADAIGMSQSSINDYENRGVEPDITTLTRMADFFETTVDYIIGHTHIRRMIMDGDEYKLTERESAVVDGYRNLPESSRKVIDDLIADMLRK